MINLMDPAVLGDPIAAYGQAREQTPVVRLEAPGFAMVAVTRYADAKAMLADPRFELNADTYMRPPVPEHCLKYMRTMQEMDGPEHTRLRRLVSPAFTARRAAEFRPRIVPIVERLLDELSATGDLGPAHDTPGGSIGTPTGNLDTRGDASNESGDVVDLLADFARPLPIDVICELLGVEDRAAWREYGLAVASGHGKAFAEAIPAIMHDAIAAVARRSAEPGEDLLSELIGVPDGLTDTELVTLVWHLVLAGQTPANLIANAVEALLTHPEQPALLRADETLMPAAVEELTRWCGPQLLSLPRYAVEDVEIAGVRIDKGTAVTAALGAANRDPRAFDDPDRLDVTREGSAHLGYAHGPHFCLGAALARVQTEVALTGLLRRYPALALDNAVRMPDPATLRLASLTVRCG